ncbi:hypothetical protein FISHEDRAFT_68685 [Fistulina hepatica ATCC 64428]|uniref:Uncharacterized protein n=1 Tax=Fistulina hepatica ATCC 64428 TaxID=1128425 RepID=A0A0D7AQP5_9AGAR|nr:hypothetical protein FISHEDRAFT_68685 [Fistulina hepatica ATCC 64428]
MAPKPKIACQCTHHCGPLGGSRDTPARAASGAAQTATADILRREQLDRLAVTPEEAPTAVAGIAVPVILGAGMPATAGTASSTPGAAPTTGQHAKPGKKMKLSTRLHGPFASLKSDFAAKNPHIRAKGCSSLAEEFKIHLENRVVVSAAEVQLWETRASNTEGAQAQAVQSQDPYSTMSAT